MAARPLQLRLHVRRYRLGVLFDAFRLVLPDFIDAFDDRQKADARSPIAVARRKVRAAKERFRIRRQKHRQRPAAAPRSAAELIEDIQRVHIDRVDIRSFLAVDLDADVVLVQVLGDLLVHERLAFHDVAPVAAGVADRQEDQLLFLLGFGQRLGSPRVPVHRIVGVQQQVRARLVGQLVGVLGLLVLAILRRLLFLFLAGRIGARRGGWREHQETGAQRHSQKTRRVKRGHRMVLGGRRGWASSARQVTRASVHRREGPAV